MSTPAVLIEFNQYINNRSKKFLYVRDIKHTLKHYNLDTKGKKAELLERLDNFFSNLKSKNKFHDEIVTIQKNIRGYLTRKKLRNKEYFFRHKCTNKEDFYTFQDINEIEELYYFSYKDQDNFEYFFDIRSFEKLIQTKNNNPYNRSPIPNHAKNNFFDRMKIVMENPNFKPFETPKLTEDQKYKHCVTDVFQKIDQTGCIAGGTDINWFLNLSQIQLVNFYKILEDIWIYRANLSTEEKNAIVPGCNIFKSPLVYYLKKKKFKKRAFEYLVLKEMEKLVSSSHIQSNRSTGAYYILIALVEVSPQCADALPWLIQ